jgi:hypothetical protein
VRQKGNRVLCGMHPILELGASHSNIKPFPSWLAHLVNFSGLHFHPVLERILSRKQGQSSAGSLAQKRRIDERRVLYDL